MKSGLFILAEAASLDAAGERSGWGSDPDGHPSLFRRRCLFILYSKVTISGRNNTLGSSRLTEARAWGGNGELTLAMVTSSDESRTRRFVVSVADRFALSLVPGMVSCWVGTASDRRVRPTVGFPRMQLLRTYVLVPIVQYEPIDF